MMRFLLIGAVLTAVSVLAFAQEAPRTMYIAPTDDGFEVYLAAAMHKKGVPVTVVNKEACATYVLKGASIQVHKESTGSKVTRCLFLYCAGIEDKANTSVQLTKGEKIKWSYAVNKGRGQKNRQSMAEAIAKHLKSEYFNQPLQPGIDTEVHCQASTPPAPPTPAAPPSTSPAPSTTSESSAPASAPQTSTTTSGVIRGDTIGSFAPQQQPDVAAAARQNKADKKAKQDEGHQNVPQ